MHVLVYNGGRRERAAERNLLPPAAATEAPEVAVVDAAVADIDFTEVAMPGVVMKVMEMQYVLWMLHSDRRHNQGHG